MRTSAEVIARVDEIKDRDFFGFETNDLICTLESDEIRQLYPTEDLEQHVALPRDRDSVIARMLDYMPFAWDKSNGFRGLSAGRSMAHFSAWVWLAGDDLGDLMSYEFYGKDNLVKICQLYGWDYTQWDDGVRLNSEPDYE